MLIALSLVFLFHSIATLVGLTEASALTELFIGNNNLCFLREVFYLKVSNFESLKVFVFTFAVLKEMI